MPFKGTAMPETSAGSAVQAFFRVAEVAARFEVDETTIYRQIKAGRLKAIRIGTGRGTVRVTAAALAEYEENITSAAAQSAELTVDTPLGPVDLVAIERCRTGRPVTLTTAETAFFTLLTERATAGVA
jgi:excisionase family DNA binding protein